MIGFFWKMHVESVGQENKLSPFIEGKLTPAQTCQWEGTDINPNCSTLRSPRPKLKCLNYEIKTNPPSLHNLKWWFHDGVQSPIQWLISSLVETSLISSIHPMNGHKMTLNFCNVSRRCIFWNLIYLRHPVLLVHRMSTMNNHWPLLDPGVKLPCTIQVSNQRPTRKGPAKSPAAQPACTDRPNH